MWNGASGSRTPSASSSASRNGSARGTRRRSSRACARSRERVAPSRRAARSRRRRRPIRDRARVPSPRCRTAPRDPSPRVARGACRAARRPRRSRPRGSRPRRKPGMEDDELGAARRDDARAPVECADGRRELAPARLEVAHEAEERCVHGERDVVLARQLAEALRERVVHPEAALEVDLARGVAALEERSRSPARATRGTACGPGRRGCATPRLDPSALM